MKRLSNHLRRYFDQPMVRPFALAGPVLVLVIALPLLRPLRHPAEPTNDQVLRMATIRALVERHSLSLDKGYSAIAGSVTTPGGVYSAQPPMMAVLLWAPAWIMTRLGLDFDSHQLLIEYLLTLLGVTLPVAGAAGLIYRMGRLFELRRPWRAGMGFAVVAGSGLLSYSVVLNAQAPAAVLILGSVACLIHVAAIDRQQRHAIWFALAGVCASVAAALDPAACVALILLACVIPTMRFSIGRRLAGIALYALGAVPPVLLHAAWNIPVTGDIVPASVHLATSNRQSIRPAAVIRDDFEESQTHSLLATVGANAWWLANALAGRHGLLSHFPVLAIGVLGIGAVMHRHWPTTTKSLAAASGITAIAVIIIYGVARLDWTGAMFATRWFIVFTPMLLFWAGAWLRRAHSKPAWIVAALMLLFSTAVGLIGATDPTPRHGYDRYTAAAALMKMIHHHDQPELGALVRQEL